MRQLAVIAIGGNSLIKDSEHQFVEDQYTAICETVSHIVDIIESGIDVIVTHGNGPQVGFIMRRSEIAEEYAHMHPVPLVSCDADTQGAIGYQIQQAMFNEFRKRGIDKEAVTIVTQVIVDKGDPAFLEPSKPIGSFYNEEQVEKIKKDHPSWILALDAGRGYRQVVASPKPQAIVEKSAIEMLVRNGFSVIAVGGGGIPVIEVDNQLVGVNAVIDKDYASAMLAADLNADYFIISTAVNQVSMNYNQSDERSFDHLSLGDISRLRAEGQFAKGSMLPKINAVEQFILAGGKKAIITSPGLLKEAVEGKAGTVITRE